MKRVFMIVTLNTTILFLITFIYLKFNGYDVFTAVENPSKKILIRHYFMSVSIIFLLFTSFTLSFLIITRQKTKNQ
ncbi:hypothetical protein BKP45_10160 [Anaerobacillus alkalidiazotrophicus]|uniref:Uncharacterized protein n=1 Tax=Anaerobacillus alkalidiazotrophicus TaxID=472963 RepID=A0A1S2M635_9BACI|nr:hypothetical protein BKP45_10160 [Anaerobacillus alkalidiazotrophicus]